MIRRLARRTSSVPTHPAVGRVARELLRWGQGVARASQGRPRASTNALRIISEKYRFIYVGVPLCGTHTALHSLVHRPPADFQAYTRKRDIGELLADDPRYAGYFKFAFVRNPWSRVVSCYIKKILNADTLGKLHLISRYPGLRPGMSFRDFVGWLCSDEGQDACADKHWISQVKLLSDAAGRMCCDHVGRLERIQEEFELIFRTIGVPPVRLPALAVSGGLRVRGPHASFRDYYDATTAEMVAERYRQDIERLGYEF